MFVKAYKSRGHTYLKIVRSVRKNGTPTHEIIANLGRADRLKNGELDGIVKSLKKYTHQDEAGANAWRKDISTMTEEDRVNYGYLAYRALWQQFGLHQALTDFSTDRKISYDYAATVFSMVVNHALNPSSKRALHENKNTYAGLNNGLQLHHLYRSLDLLAEHKSKLETFLFNKNRTLFNMIVDVVFFDVTTFYFESQQADMLRDFGFGKDGKINEVQVVMALLIDSDGRPITFELFAGNTFEGHTLLTTLDRLKDRFQIRQVIIVADKGLNSKLNLKEIKDRGYDYIVSCRLKNLPQKTKDRALDDSGYASITPEALWGESQPKSATKKKKSGETDSQPETPRHTFKYKVLDYTNVLKYPDAAQGKTVTVTLAEKLVCTWSSKRAAKDRADRQRQIEKAEKAINSNQKSILSHRGYKRYIQTGGTDTDVLLSLNQDKIEAEARFDGYTALQCSRADMDAVAVMRAYRQLLKIEESFRVMKTTLRTRPVFVWSPAHVKGHFVMCFLAFVLERELEYRLNKRGINNSPERIKAALRSMQCSELSIEGERFFLKGKHEPLASKICGLLKMKQPVHLMTEPQWQTYLNRY